MKLLILSFFVVILIHFGCAVDRATDASLAISQSNLEDIKENKDKKIINLIIGKVRNVSLDSAYPKEALSKSLRENKDRIIQCYEADHFYERVTMTLTIGKSKIDSIKFKDSDVSNGSNPLGSIHPTLEACVTRIIHSWQLPIRRNALSMQIEVDLVPIFE